MGDATHKFVWPVLLLTLMAGLDRSTAAQTAPQGSPADASQAIDFADKPSFTIAGVTDWTAVGGHGSDSILRTSEDLARETLELKAPGAGKQDLASEGKLRAALAGSPGSFAANHELGAFYLHAGRYHDAVPLLQAAYQAQPSDSGNEYDLAVALMEDGDYSQARTHAQKMLAQQDKADLHRLLGQIDEKMSDPLHAVHEDEQAARLDPSESNYFAWGSELLLHRAVWQAAEVFKQGTRAYPKSARMLTGLGTAQFAGALYDEAATSLCEASDLNPTDTEPYLFMGQIAMAAPKPLDCVRPRLARLVEQRPRNASANYLYAMAILKSGEQTPSQSAQQAEPLLSKAVTLDPKCADAYLQLGILAFSEHDLQKAIHYYTQAIEAQPQLGEAHYRLGVAYDRMGAPEKARQEFDLHDQLEKLQAARVDQQRRDVKQFLVVLEGQPGYQAPPK